ncbi:CHY zinc finger protein [Planococcus salinus]|uniref:CHY-type domain-containing protein n=1 Tax=Planococcus salinus TaxID=1848460 RepID=A0A3M8P9B1_9BACL|nr:CHY zinc finger protein [Planococcus salinus]RNF40295.1 hypothetical protein EEX84_06590 [Planococcus salinus]
MASRIPVKGLDVDEETRCRHYHSEIDRIAIKFYCCGQYYACFACHQATGCGKPKVWPAGSFDQKAVLCGGCGHELSVTEYLQCQSTCPNCAASFNPGCSLHKHLYFA